MEHEHLIGRLVEGMPAHEYHALPFVSASRLKAMRRSAMHCKWEMEHPRRSPALDFGAAFHSYCEDADRFRDLYAVAPKVDGRTKAGKEANAAFASTAGDKTVIDTDDFYRIAAMTAAVLSHPEARRLMQAPATVEASGFWHDDEHGIGCKLRTDRLLTANNDVIDIKTCNDASPDAFALAMHKYGYGLQAAWYLDGLNKIGRGGGDFILIAVEKDPPYGVAVYRVDGDTLQHGYDQARDLLGTYAECVRTGVWPCYSDNIEPINLPAWALGPVDEFTLTLDGESVRM